MRFNIAHAALVGLLVSSPLVSTHPFEKTNKRQDLAFNHESNTTVEHWALGSRWEGKVKRRHIVSPLNPRGGVPKLGDKPKPKDRDPKDGPSVNPGKAPDETSGVGTAAGTAPKAVFEDGNLEQARAKGARLSEDLDEAIFNNIAQPEKKNLQSLGYTVAGRSKPPYNAKDEKRIYLTDLGIDIEGSIWMEKAVWRKDSTSVSSARLPILLTSSDIKQETIVIKQSWKDRDEAVPKASWTDLIHDVWVADNSKDGGDPAKIRYVARDNIQFQPTKDSKGIDLNTPPAIDAVFEKLKADKTKTLIIPAKSDDPDVKGCYELLAAQTHVARVLQWFKDYHTVLGDPKISALHVTKQGEHPSGIYSIVIEVIH